MVKKSTAIITVIFLLIGLIHSVIIEPSINIFLTWFFIGLWIIFTIKIIENTKRYREFNSPHNTAFFIVVIVFVGIFYTIWSNFTGLFVDNILNDSNLYLSWWSLLFGLPYIIYGLIALYRCFKKYNVVYFGTNSIKARPFGFILAISILISIITYWIIFYVVIDFYEFPLVPLHFSLDLSLLLMVINTALILIIAGIFGKGVRLPRLTRDYVTRRSRSLDSITRPVSSTRPTRQRQRTRTSRTVSSRTTPPSQLHTVRSSTRTKTKTRASTKTTTIPLRKQSTKVRNLDKYKPKAAILSPDDFKCIFCFKLPQLPKDQGRGIVLCPNCRFPAHADEFKDWLRNSSLCSRCDTPLPNKYRRNPPTIRVKNYLLVYKNFLKKRR